MFTSRAEHRLLLGCDSVYARLTPIARRLGILDSERQHRAEARVERMRRAAEVAETTLLNPDRETQTWLAEAGIELTSQTPVGRLTQRSDFDLDRFIAAASTPLPELASAFSALNEEEAEGVASRLRYSGYIERQQREATRAATDEDAKIPNGMEFALPGLSREVVEKLSTVRPASLGQASRIPGMTPAAVAVLRMHLRRGASAAGRREW